MKGYVAYPKLDPSRGKQRHMNVCSKLEDARIWVDGWYGEELDIYEVDYNEEHIIETVDGTVQTDLKTIIPLSWTILCEYNSIRFICRTDEI